MIEYALLFGLGFLSAALLAVLLAPAIHRRIVLFTENRLKATMPLSPQEIRAQKDMARAVYAAENAKTTQNMLKEREKAVALQLQNDTLAREASRLLGENQQLAATIEDMKVEAGELRSQARREDTELTNLREALKRTEEQAATKDLEVESALKRLERLAREIDNLKIERSAGEAQMENLKQRVQILRDEREELRREASLATRRAKETEQRLAQEEHTRLRLDDRLVREMANNADKAAVIERRQAEIERLKTKVKQSNAATRAAARALRAAGLPTPEPTSVDAETSDSPAPAMISNGPLDAGQLADELRNRQTALGERLKKARTPGNDDALREEIADIAAGMIVLAATNEGKASPIREILSNGTSKGAGKRMTLAERAQLRPELFDRPE